VIGEPSITLLDTSNNSGAGRSEQRIGSGWNARVSGLGATLTRLGALVDIDATHPLLRRHRVNTEVLRDLLDRHSALARSLATRITSSRKSLGYGSGTATSSC
jgi:hypothetical protein